MGTARAFSTTTCGVTRSCASGWRSFAESLLAVFHARRAPRRGQRSGYAQHAQHAKRAFLASFAAAVVARHEHRLVEAHRAVEAPCGFVARAQLEVDARDAGAARRLEHPFEHALADARAAVRRAHREQHEMRALLAEFHDGEAVGCGTPARRAPLAVAGDPRERLAVADRAHHARGVIFRSEERRVGKECRSRWSP